MPTIVFQDDFVSYSVGQSLPFGSWTGGGAIVPFGCPGPGALQSLRVDTTAQFNHIVQKMTLYFSLAISDTDFQGAIVALHNHDPLTPLGIPLAGLALERDFSVTLTGPNGNFLDSMGVVANSMIQKKQFVQPNGCHFVKMELDFTNPGTAINVTATVQIDQTDFCNGQQDTGVLPASTFLGIRAVNIHQWVAAKFGGIFIDNVTLYDDVGGPIPNPAVPPLPNIRATQFSVEPLLQPSDENVRATQMVVEPLIQPANGNIRVTQMVLEIIGKAVAPTVKTRPQYIKRHNAPANN